MGLQSAMTTALTGLQAAETTIDVVGNNVANAGTTGFKESDVLFATQFLQTQSIGSAPSADRGGTNPRQIGLGVKVAAINPNWTQGTIEISANPLDVAIQGNGFLIVQGSQGQLFTRNGQIQTNNANELVTVTGNRVVGYSVDENFDIVPIEGTLRIPIGEAPVSQVTRTAFLQGVLTPQADEGDQASIIASDILGDFEYAFPNDPDFDTGDFQLVNTPPGTPIGQGNYSYYIAFTDGTTVSRPSAQIGPITVGPNQQIQISNIPQPPVGSGFTGVNIYRNLASNSSEFYLLNTTPLTTTTFTDDLSDDAIDNNPPIDLIGAKAGNGTRLVNVLVRDGDTYVRPFEQMGTLSFEGRRGGRTLGAKELEIDATTTVQSLISFMEDSFGITSDIDLDDLPYSLPEADGTIGTDGIIRFTSNAGLANSLGVTLASFNLTSPGEETPVPVSLPFTETLPAHGEGSLTDFVVFDSLGSAVNVRISTVLEEKNDTFTRYRWFATSDDNEPIDSVSTFVGSGTIVFDSNGNIESGGIGEISISRNQSASASPLTVDLDFSQVSGLALTNSQGEDVSNMSMTRQDGFPPGTLSSFIITESGLIRGIFTNGAERPLGQIRMARFTNNTGLQQVGENLFATGVNSGEPIKGNPGDSGIGTLTAGALELSNTDIGQNLIELILASTQYRGGARVITTAQQLLDELLSLRR